MFLAGRTLANLERVAGALAAGPGAASGVGIAEVDALDAGAVDCHADEVVAAAGSIDISFNLISHPFVQGSPVVEMSPEEYVDPVLSTVRSTFLTALAAARHMIGQRSGVILMFGGAADPPRGGRLGSLQVALHAVEAMRRQSGDARGRRRNRGVRGLGSRAHDHRGEHQHQQRDSGRSPGSVSRRDACQSGEARPRTDRYQRDRTCCPDADRRFPYRAVLEPKCESLNAPDFA